MKELAFITGTLDPGTEIRDDLLKEIDTKYGTANFVDTKRYPLILRHGIEHNVPPHRIKHRANIEALVEMGIKRVVSFCSVGSLKRSLGPGEIIIADDFIDLYNKATFYDDEIRHITPTLHNPLREEVVELLGKIGLPHRIQGIYVQTRGPRLETRAEISMYSNFGDIVGMTMASEATLACERELEYCPICFVDNYCNGVVDEPLSFKMIMKHAEKNRQISGRIIKAIVERENYTIHKNEENQTIRTI